MLKHIEEYGKYIEITGFRDAKIIDVKAFLETIRRKLPPECEIQLFDADLVATWQHLYFAVLNALTAFETKRNLSKSIAVETALYASAQRQISKALAKIGVTSKTENIAAIALSENAGVAESGAEAVSKKLGKKPDETVLELTAQKTKRIRQLFEISEAELGVISGKDKTKQALIDLVVERLALLATRL